MEQEDFKRKLTSILSADAVGYSRLMGEDESATVRTIKSYRKVFASLINDHKGRVVDSHGDNLLAEFDSVVAALRCAWDIQQEIKSRNDELSENRRMNFRIGINLGDVIEEEGRIYGDGVNIAARIEGLSEESGISISGTVYDHVKNKLPLKYEYQGVQSVKNIAEPVRIYRVLMETETPVRSAPDARMAFPLPDKPSIAVIPFDNMSGDPNQGYIADGISENIISALSKLSELFVIARNSSFTYKGKPIRVQQVAEDFGVRYVLEGSVQKSADNIRVTAQLINAMTGFHLWSDKYDRKMDNFFNVQDDITLNIAIAMQVKLTEGEQAKIRHSTNNLEAWSFAVKAHGLFETYTREDIAKARKLFKQAVELDPNYAYAWSYLGWTYWIDGVYYSAYYDRKKSFESATEMAEKALSADDKSSDAHALLCGVNLSLKKFNEAVAAGEKTIDLDPNSSENHAIVAITMQNVGKFEEAIALLKQAMRLDPYYPGWYLGRLGMCYRMIGMYEESAKALEEMVKRDQERGTAAPWDRNYLYLATTYSMMGRLEEARDLVSKALEFNPKMTAELWGKRFQYKDHKHTNRILDALRKVGLPE